MQNIDLEKQISLARVFISYENQKELEKNVEVDLTLKIEALTVLYNLWKNYTFSLDHMDHLSFSELASLRSFNKRMKKFEDNHKEQLLKFDLERAQEYIKNRINSLEQLNLKVSDIDFLEDIDIDRGLNDETYIPDYTIKEHGKLTRKEQLIKEQAEKEMMEFLEKKGNLGVSFEVHSEKKDIKCKED